MVEIDLKKAVSGIKAPLLETLEHNSTDYPFFLIFGAGVSYPSIPLADGIVDRCRERLQKLGADLPPETSNPLKRYETHFQAAFEHKKSRQEFLSGLIRTKQIPAATFRLAHLLGTGKLTNLVFTPNFDELLSRALRLLGFDEFVICDHPTTTQRINPNAKELQLIHVHGTHWFYDCCNLSHEIENRSTGGMRDRLDEVLHTRSPIVVGYSGWEDDVIMKALRRRIEGKDLPFNLYWFCYRRAEAQLLPKWLTEHDDVRLVVPQPAPATQPLADGPSSPSSNLKGPAPALSFEGAPSPEPVLPANRVFDALIEALQLQPPRLTSDPLGFFAGHLETSLYLEDSKPGADPYGLQDILRRVRAAVAFVQEQTDALEEVRNGMRSAAYAKAIEAAHGINLDVLDMRQSEELESILEQIYLAVSDPDPATALDVCNLRSEVCERILGLKGVDPTWAVRAAKALHGQGYCLVQLDQPQEALNRYNQILGRFGESQEPGMLKRIVAALLNRGMVLVSLERVDEAIASFDEVMSRSADATDPTFREKVAEALFTKGVALGEKGADSEALAAYDEILRRFNDATEPILRKWVASALFNKGNLFRRAGKREEAVAQYDEVIRRFGEGNDPSLREQVVMALVNKGHVLGQEKELAEQAVATAEEVIHRAGDSTDPLFREAVAKALVNKGAALTQMGDIPRTISAHDELIQRFGEAPEPEVREWVARAYLEKGMCLGKLGDTPGEIACYDEILRRFADSTEPAVQESLAMARYNRACVQALAGSIDEALEGLKLCLEGGDITREHVAQDKDWEGLRGDARYLELMGTDKQPDIKSSQP